MKNNKLNKNDILAFGKYQGHLIKDIMETDPRYLEWALLNVDYFDLCIEDKSDLRLRLLSLDDENDK